LTRRSASFSACSTGFCSVEDAADIRLANPSRHRLTTKWPAFLPSPLFTLHPGETARIDWNGAPSKV
jgi:hypothetical protein